MNINNLSLKSEDNGGQKIRNASFVLFGLFCSLILILAYVKPLYLPIKYFALPILLLLLCKYDLFDFIIFPLTIYDSVIGMYISNRYSLIWFYLAVLIVKLIYTNSKSIKLNKIAFLNICLLILYFSIFYLYGYGMASIKIICIIFCSSLIAMRIRKDALYTKNIAYVIYTSSIINVIALLTGLTGTIEGVSRQLGLGFTDPNYTSYVCALGLAVVLFMKSDKTFSIISSILFILAILKTGSRAGFLITCLLILMKIALAKGIIKKVKIIFSMLIISALVFIFILPLISNDINNLVSRLVLMWDGFSAHNYGDATAGRSDIAQNYINYFKNQPFIRQLFGGNLVGSQQLLWQVGCNHVTHNTYLDYLLAFGILGSAAFLGTLTVSIITYYKKYRTTGEQSYLVISLIKVISLVFGVSLAFLQVNLWWFVALV